MTAPVSLIGVTPDDALMQRRRLFSLLEAAYPVRFVPGSHAASEGLAGRVDFASPDGTPDGLPTLAFGQPGEPVTGPWPILFGAEAPHPLAGLTLTESIAERPTVPAPGRRDIVLATSGRDPVWVADPAGNQFCAIAPAELRADERLRDALQPGRFLGLLSLVHFVRGVVGELDWVAPRPRASFICDDPNLRRPTYGWLDYGSLAEHARRHGYHFGIAMVPLDVGRASRRATDLFRGSPQLSVLMHGNNHTREELVVPDSDTGLRLASQAMRRIAAFERRHGIPVCRVMAPPHGTCSVPALAGLRRAGLEAIAYNTVPGGDELDRGLTGWEVADVHLGGGFPGMHRVHLNAGEEDLALRSYLGQPLVLYGHHHDVAGSFDALASAAERVKRVVGAEWLSTEALARSNFATRQVSSTLIVRPYSRLVDVVLPADVTEVVVEAPWAARTTFAGDAFIADRRVALGEPAAASGPTRISLAMADAVSPASVRAPAWRPWPPVRRRLTTSRDRMQPLIHRLQR